MYTTIKAPTIYKNGHPTYTKEMWQVEVPSSDALTYDHWLFSKLYKEQEPAHYWEVRNAVVNMLISYTEPGDYEQRRLNGEDGSYIFLDELDEVEFVMELEDQYGIELDPIMNNYNEILRENGKTITIGNLIDIYTAYAITGHGSRNIHGFGNWKERGNYGHARINPHRQTHPRW